MAEGVSRLKLRSCLSPLVVRAAVNEVGKSALNFIQLRLNRGVQLTSRCFEDQRTRRQGSVHDIVILRPSRGLE